MLAFTYPEEKAAELFTPLAYDADDNLFLLADKSLGFGFDCRPLSGGDKGVEDRLRVLLNMDWPKNTILQFILWASPDIETEMGAMQALRFNHDPAYHKGIARRAAFFRTGTTSPIEQQTRSMVRDIRLLVVAKLPIGAPIPSDKEIATATELEQGAERTMKAIGLGPTRLTNNKVVRILQSMLNWGDTAAWRDLIVPECDPNAVIRDQILDLDSVLDIDQRGISLKNKKIRTLSVKRYPDFAGFGMAMNYLGDVMSGTRGIRDNCIICAAVHYPDSESTRTKLETKKQWSVHQASLPITRFVPVLLERKEHYDVLFKALDDGDRPVRLYMGITLFADDDKHAAALVSDTRTYWREQGFQLLEDRYFVLPFFLNSTPFGADRTAVSELNRYRTMASRHVAPLLPVFADWRGTGTPVINTVSRNGQIMSSSLYDSGSNYNCVIAAQSGSGKSFLTNEIIISYLSVGGQCWVIDVGRSYVNLCETQGGDFLDFSQGSNICVNPFPIVKEYSEEEDMLVGLLQIMAAPNETLSDFQISGLKRVLKDVWDKHGHSLLVDHVAEALRKEDDGRMRDLGIQLYPFTSRGQYGRYFNGPNTVSFDRVLTVLELEELKGRKHLQKVILMQLIYQIQQETYRGERDRPKIVIIDESWDLLAEGDTAKFMETAYRRFRKYGAAALIITQSVTDLYDSPSGIAIAENSANMYLLGQKSEAVEAIRREKRLPLSDGGYDLLKSVHTVPGAYSEIFFITEYGYGVGRLIVDPFHQLLYSTRAEDVTAIRRLRQSGKTVDEAINHLLETRRGR